MTALQVAAGLVVATYIVWLTRLATRTDVNEAWLDGHASRQSLIDAQDSLIESQRGEIAAWERYGESLVALNEQLDSENVEARSMLAAELAKEARA